MTEIKIAIDFNKDVYTELVYKLQRMNKGELPTGQSAPQQLDERSLRSLLLLLSAESRNHPEHEIHIKWNERELILLDGKPLLGN